MPPAHPLWTRDGIDRNISDLQRSRLQMLTDDSKNLKSRNEQLADRQKPLGQPRSEAEPAGEGAGAVHPDELLHQVLALKRVRAAYFSRRAQVGGADVWS